MVYDKVEFVVKTGGSDMRGRILICCQRVPSEVNDLEYWTGERWVFSGCLLYAGDGQWFLKDEPFRQYKDQIVWALECYYGKHLV